MIINKLAKQLSEELNQTISSKDIINLLSDKKEGLKHSNNIDDDLVEYVNNHYKKSGKKAEEKQVKPAEKKTEAKPNKSTQKNKDKKPKN